MDRPHHPEQSNQFHRPRSQPRKLRSGPDHSHFSQQPARPNGDIRSTGGTPMEVEMKIRGLMMDPVTNMPIVILKDSGSDSVLPIWVGIYEANAIALEIEKVSTPRPITHDLIKNVLAGLDAHVHKVVFTELKDDTFYAGIW